MKVILSSDVKGQGKKGQLVEVSDGYARNYLLPRGLAVEANAANVNVMKTQKAAADHRTALEIAAARETAEKLKGKTVKMTAKGGENGKLFGSVTSKEIAEQLEKQFGIAIEKRKLTCPEIKAFGTYTIDAKIYPDISAEFFVIVGEA